MDNKEALVAETAFFRQQPVFKSMPAAYFGIPNLTRRLTKLLVGRIKAALPYIKWEVSPRRSRCDGIVFFVRSKNQEGINMFLPVWNVLVLLHF